MGSRRKRDSEEKLITSFVRDAFTRVWPLFSQYYRKYASKISSSVVFLASSAYPKESSLSNNGLYLTDDVGWRHHHQVHDVAKSVKTLKTISYDETDPLSLRGVFDCKMLRVLSPDVFWMAVKIPCGPSILDFSEDRSGRRSSSSSWSTLSSTEGCHSVKRILCRLHGVDIPQGSRAQAMFSVMLHTTSPAVHTLLEAVLAFEDEGVHDKEPNSTTKEEKTELTPGSAGGSMDASIAADASESEKKKERDAVRVVNEALESHNDLVIQGGIDLTKGVDKWGRHIASVKSGYIETDISRILLDAECAVPYGTFANDALFSMS